ncbi:MAG: glycosyltransferase [Bacilli bacterium]
MKKLIFVTNTLGNGGAQRVIGLLATSLADTDFSVKVICVTKYYKEYVFDGLCVDYLTTETDTINKPTRIKLLRKYLLKEKPDVIVSFEYFLNMDTIIAARGLKSKVIVSERNDPAQQKDRKLVNFLRDYLYRKADVLVCQTPDAKAYFSAKVQKHTVIIPNPVKSNLPKYCGQDSTAIINFCRLEKQKNLPLLIQAFEMLHKKHNEAKLVIYGDGKEKDKLQEIINNKNLEELIKVYPATNDIHEIASKCKMFVSSSDYEGLSNSMLEAMAIGMPVVCTDCPCGGARMVIENNVNGLLVPVGDVQSLYEAMDRILFDDKLAESLGKNASKIADDLAQDKIAEKWYNLLN